MLLYGIRFKVFEGGQVGLLFWPHAKLQSHPQFSPLSILPSGIPAFSFPSLDSGYFILLCFSSGGSGSGSRAGLTFSVWPRTTLHFWPSCLYLLTSGTAGMYHHVYFMPVRIKPKASHKVSKHSTNWPAPAACLNLCIDSWLSIAKQQGSCSSLPWSHCAIHFWPTRPLCPREVFLLLLAHFLTTGDTWLSKLFISISPGHPGTLPFLASLVAQRSAWLNSDHSIHGKGVWHHWSLRFSFEMLHMVILPSSSLASLFPLCMGVKMVEGGPVSQNNHRAEWPTQQQTGPTHSRLGYDWGALKDSNMLN